MKTIIKFISYFLLLFVCIGCNEDKNEELINDQEETIEKKLSTRSSTKIKYSAETGDFKGKRRLSIKRNRKGNWKVITSISNNEINSTVAFIETTISIEGKDDGNTISLIQTPRKKNKKFIKFKSKKVNSLNEFIGKKLKIVSVDKNEKGERIGVPVVQIIETKEDTNGNKITIEQPELRLNKDGETFTMTVALKTDPKDHFFTIELKDARISSLLIPDDGGSETVEDAISLQYMGQNEEGLFIFENQYIEFIESDNVVDMEYLSSITISDTGGEELDYAEFRITGLE
ncbi:hypothetical protein [Tenacibaculum sp. 190524A05c]|uniref:hypothetical protein n=1 Tax=Tenacibaculum platacis TaxID=3137852 RepID=UPI0032B12531